MQPVRPDVAQLAEAKTSTFQKIWLPFLILLVITITEFIIALGLNIPKGIKDGCYVVLTLMKAFYIVGYFMHLKFERINLAYCIVVPTMFIMALIAALIFEGGSLRPY